MATLKEVAELAGVSVSTASAVINGREIGIRVGPPARARIMDAVRQVGYEANAAARGLRTGKSYLAGVFTGSILSSYTAEALQGVENILMRQGYGTVLCSCRDNGEFERKLDFLRKKNADGMIVIPDFHNDAFNQLYRTAAATRPTVFMAGSGTPPPDTVTVRADGAAIAHLGTSYLLGLGHRRIALLLGNCTERLDGYRQALADAGIPFDAALVTGNINGFEDGQAALPRLAGATAVLAQGDTVAAGVIAAAGRAGIAVPGQLSVLGVDDMPLAGMITPALTTVAQPRLEQGELAAQLLLRMIAGEPRPQSVWLTPRLVERDSCRRIA